MPNLRHPFMVIGLITALMVVIEPAQSSEPDTAQAATLPTIPYGAVYFRKSNPPDEDWQRDYQQAAADGMNCFRHWFLWSAIEVAPGEYDWADYDRQLDLAAENGIKTIIADILATAPEWAFKKYPHARVESADGSKAASHYTAACAVGGAPGLCLDNEEVKQQAGNFLRAMVTRYRNHPGLGGYDVWNELNMNGGSGGCYCEASAEKFREWLKAKYGDLAALNKAWYRYSYASWDDVQIPRNNDPYPDSIDWALFRIDNAMRLFKWRVGIIRSLDSQHPVTAHAIPLGVIEKIGPQCYPVFQVGKLVDVYGYSGGCNHDERTKLRWMHWCNMDMTRSAAQGKPFWCAEMPAGFSWRWPLLKMEEGRMTTASDVRLYSMMHFAGGAQGVFSPRWRPLLDGRFAGYFGFYDLDGSPTERSAAAGHMARWANAPEQEHLWQAKPVKGDINILVVPESQIHCYATHDSTEFYYQSVIGAYQAFLFNNVQADFVHIDDLGPEHDLVYLPYPVMLLEKTANKLKGWVRQGGHLICEGCPAYFGDRGRAGEQQPNYGLDELFGAKQQWVQFTPDLLNDLTFQLSQGPRVKGAIYLQSYAPTSGEARGHYEDGRIAVVDHTYGRGKTRLIGTFAGYAYHRTQDSRTKQFLADLLTWAGKRQHVTCSDPRIVARLHTGDGTRFLYVVNTERQDIVTELTLSPKWRPVSQCNVIFGDARPVLDGQTISVEILARDALVLELKSSAGN